MARRMRHQQYLVVVLFPDNGQSRINICKILFQAFAEERILTRQDRAAVFAEVHGVEIVAMCVHAVAQLLLKEIIIVAMYIKYSLFGVRQLRLLDKRADHFPLIIVRHLDSPAEITVAQYVGNVLGIKG